MTARVPSVEPTFANEAERLVWTTLRDQLPGDAILIPGLRIVDETLDHEADVIVLLPDAGVVVVEVKGGSVWYGARDRDATTDEPPWWQQGDGQRRIDPVQQALRVKYAVRDYVEVDPRWDRQRVVWGHAVVTPYSTFPDDFAAPDCPRWALHHRGDLATLGQWITDNARRASQGRRPPTHDDVELISESLKGRGFTAYDRNAEAAERQGQADHGYACVTNALPSRMYALGPRLNVVERPFWADFASRGAGVRALNFTLSGRGSGATALPNFSRLTSTHSRPTCARRGPSKWVSSHRRPWPCAALLPTSTTTSIPGEYGAP